MVVIKRLTYDYFLTNYRKFQSCRRLDGRLFFLFVRALTANKPGCCRHSRVPENRKKPPRAESSAILAVSSVILVTSRHAKLFSEVPNNQEQIVSVNYPILVYISIRIPPPIMRY